MTKVYTGVSDAKLQVDKKKTYEAIKRCKFVVLKTKIKHFYTLYCICNVKRQDRKIMKYFSAHNSICNRYIRHFRNEKETVPVHSQRLWANS